MTAAAPPLQSPPAPAPGPDFPQLLRAFLRIGLLSFGGPAGQIALMHRELVEERRWVGEEDFLHALNFCHLLPGPEAQQLAVVTFGGAYAVLAYMAQEAVQGFGWLAPGEMADGLGLAETTPGPLILVTQFVGYLAAFRASSPCPPRAASRSALQARSGP